jgi:hypothetical protein
MFNAFSTANSSQDTLLLTEALGRYEKSDWLADNFFSFIAEEAVGTRVPAGDYAIEVFADDCVFGGLHNRRQSTFGEHAIDFECVGFHDVSQVYQR